MRWAWGAIACSGLVALCVVPAGPATAIDRAPLTLVNSAASVVFRGDDASLSVKSASRFPRCQLLLAEEGARTWVKVRTFSIRTREPVSQRVSTTSWPAGNYRLRVACAGSSVTRSVTVLEPPDWDAGRIDFTGVTPGFDPGVPDYASRADAETGACLVPVSATLPAGLRVRVDGQPATSGSMSTRVRLLPGQRFRLAVQRAEQTRTYSIRCLPEDFPRFTATGAGTAQWYVGDLVFDRSSGT